ncbi:hypothetical protein [Luteimonas terrae]|uniref:Uncharacterized protein n=1 Tax=Luteimonas terrae TaxID=1530191 RepID=A0ABU1Y0L7_9GAMM|nr:hypothetical protein [Luteimonas terrae]MDR7194568.1 hypothetical protein [Luteimonas terrae]
MKILYSGTDPLLHTNLVGVLFEMHVHHDACGTPFQVRGQEVMLYQVSVEEHDMALAMELLDEITTHVRRSARQPVRWHQRVGKDLQATWKRLVGSHR